MWGTLPLGGFLGGALGSTIGIRPRLWVAAAGQAIAFVWLIPSPIPSMHDRPEPLASAHA